MDKYQFTQEQKDAMNKMNEMFSKEMSPEAMAIFDTEMAKEADKLPHETSDFIKSMEIFDQCDLDKDGFLDDKEFAEYKKIYDAYVEERYNVKNTYSKETADLWIKLAKGMSE